MKINKNQVFFVGIVFILIVVIYGISILSNNGNKSNSCEPDERLYGTWVNGTEESEYNLDIPFYNSYTFNEDGSGETNSDNFSWCIFTRNNSLRIDFTIKIDNEFYDYNSIITFSEDNSRFTLKQYLEGKWVTATYFKE